MDINPTTIAVIALGLLVFVAHGLEDFFKRTKVPDVLILLFIGLLLGPIIGVVGPDHMGKVGPVFTTMTLVVILFVGGLGLDLKMLAKSLVGATGLTVWNFVGSMAVVSPFGRLFLGFDWLQSLTLGAILGGVNTALVVPIIKRLTLKERTKTILTLECALSDVLVIVVALALIGDQMVVQEGGSELQVGQLLSGMVVSFAFAAVIGGLAGMFWSLALSRLHGLKKSIFTTPAFVLVVYGLVESIGLNGAIAALMIGITLSNIKAMPPMFLKKRSHLLVCPNETELAVFEEVAFLLKTFFFVYIGISIQLSDPRCILAGLGIATVLFFVRTLVVHASFVPKASFSRFEAALTGALNPKGLSAAVMASIPLQMGLPKGEELQMIVFSVVMFSTLIASLLIFLVERGWLGGLWSTLYSRFDPEQGGE